MKTIKLLFCLFFLISLSGCSPNVQDCTVINSFTSVELESSPRWVETIIVFCKKDERIYKRSFDRGLPVGENPVSTYEIGKSYLFDLNKWDAQ